MADAKFSRENASDYERILTSSLSRAIDFVKFAEAKNAALLTFSSAWSLAITSIVANRNLSGLDVTALGLSRALFIVAILVATWSFLPKQRPEWFHRNPEKPKNLLYYGDIAQFECDTFATKVKQAYGSGEHVLASDRYLDDLVAQVWINSRIAKRKFGLFDAGAKIAFVGVAIAASPALMAGLHWVGQFLPGSKL